MFETAIHCQNHQNSLSKHPLFPLITTFWSILCSIDIFKADLLDF